MIYINKQIKIILLLALHQKSVFYHMVLLHHQPDHQYKHHHPVVHQQIVKVDQIYGNVGSEPFLCLMVLTPPLFISIDGIWVNSTKLRIELGYDFDV